MNAGDSPEEIIDWLEANDVSGTPEFRQYGVVAMVDGSVETAAYTGTSTQDYKGHILGPNYSIQGNILAGEQILDSIEARFLRAEGDLACRLMSALQGANVVGADSRCASNNSSSLFAYIKVAQPDDDFGSPSFIASVRTNNNDGIEPIDSLQTKFDAVHDCVLDTVDTTTSIEGITNADRFHVFPNPATNEITIQRIGKSQAQAKATVLTLDGRIVFVEQFREELTIDISELPKGAYIIRATDHGEIFTQKFVKEDD